MSCCNSKVKVSDLVDLSFIDDFCDFNEQTKEFLELAKKNSCEVSCCNKDKYVIRFQKLNDLKVLFTFEDKESGTVDFIDATLINNSDSVESLFKRLVQVNQIKQDSTLAMNLIGYLLSKPNNIKLDKNNKGFNIVEISDYPKVILGLEFETITKESADPILSKVEYRSFTNDLTDLGLQGIFNVLNKELKFMPTKIEKFGTNDESFNVTMTVNLDELTNLNLKVFYLNQIDKDLSEHLDLFTKECL